MDAMLTFESDMFCNVTRLRQAGYDGQVRSPSAHGQALVAVRRGSCGWPRSSKDVYLMRAPCGRMASCRHEHVNSAVVGSGLMRGCCAKGRS
jgi:hypothetical protein